MIVTIMLSQESSERRTIGIVFRDVKTRPRKATVLVVQKTLHLLGGRDAPAGMLALKRMGPRKMAQLVAGHEVLLTIGTDDLAHFLCGCCRLVECTCAS